MESAGRHVLRLGGAQDDLGRSELLPAEDMGEIRASGRGRSGGADSAAGPYALPDPQLDPEIGSASAEDLRRGYSDRILLGIGRYALGTGAADLGYDYARFDPSALDRVEGLLQSQSEYIEARADVRGRRRGRHAYPFVGHFLHATVQMRMIKAYREHSHRWKKSVRATESPTPSTRAH